MRPALVALALAGIALVGCNDRHYYLCSDHDADRCKEAQIASFPENGVGGALCWQAAETFCLYQRAKDKVPSGFACVMDGHTYKTWRCEKKTTIGYSEGLGTDEQTYPGCYYDAKEADRILYNLQVQAQRNRTSQ